ncbi:MAG: N-acyl homoserine lactonase family protein [Betaproteobacteria bacterium]|nr:N-acyl homoserine lactonase family protein [Betaproteobacteria bacterium]
MKAYFFEAGILKSQKQYFTFAVDVGKQFDVPVPFMLIDHPRGKVLFDTGNALEVVNEKEKHWGGILAAYDPVMTKEQWCVNAIKKVGVKAEDIDFVVLSHLHLDHAGGVGQFPNATYVVQREELSYAYIPDSFMRGAYIRKDFDRQVDWLLLNGWTDDKFDLFGDGSVVTHFTPGHTPGHQSLMLTLPESGKFFLTADSCYTEENLNKNILPGLAWNFGECERTMARIRKLQRAEGAKIITGHDPEAWKACKQAPEFYR